jgi:hypothetical protein
VDAIRALLEEIHSGKTSFLPVSATEPDMIAFQALAKTLVFANEQGYLDGFLPHRESSTEHGWYDCVVIENGLSYQGEAYLMSLLKATPVESTALASRADIRASAHARSPVAEHLRILEFASRNELPHILDRLSTVSYQVTCELIDAGHLSGLFANATHGMSVINPRITLSGRLFLEEHTQPRGASPDTGTRLKITLDTNCIINLFDRQSASASSVSELSTLIQYALSGKISISITTRVETDLMNDQDLVRRADMLRTLSNFPVIGTAGVWNVSKWDSGDVFSNDELASRRDDIQGIVFPGLQMTDKRYANKRNDVDHLLGHLINEQDIFVTDDGDILRHRANLRRSPGIVVMSPLECLKHVDSL